jgi:hypothetical protein
MMDKVPKLDIYECYAPSSEPPSLSISKVILEFREVNARFGVDIAFGEGPTELPGVPWYAY